MNTRGNEIAKKLAGSVVDILVRDHGCKLEKHLAIAAEFDSVVRATVEISSETMLAVVQKAAASIGCTLCPEGNKRPYDCCEGRWYCEDIGGCFLITNCSSMRNGLILIFIALLDLP